MNNYFTTLFDHETIFALAVENAEESRVPEALCLLEKTLEMDNQFAPAHAYLGWLMANNYEEFNVAEEHLREALQIEENDPFANISLIQVLRMKGKYEEAVLMIEKSMETYDDYALLFYELGLNNEKLENINAAINAFKNAIRYSDENTDMQSISESLYRCELKLTHRSKTLINNAKTTFNQFHFAK